jgi:hypothetical protein
VRRPGSESTAWTWQPRLARCRAATRPPPPLPRPGQDRHRGGRKAGDGQVGQAASGVLHHLDEVDVQVLDHGAVDRAHLLGGQRRDRAAAHGTHGRSPGVLFARHPVWPCAGTRAGRKQVMLKTRFRCLPRPVGDGRSYRVMRIPGAGRPRPAPLTGLDSPSRVSQSQDGFRIGPLPLRLRADCGPDRTVSRWLGPEACLRSGRGPERKRSARWPRVPFVLSHLLFGAVAGRWVYWQIGHAGAGMRLQAHRPRLGGAA